MSSSTTDDKIEILLFNNREVIDEDIEAFGTAFGTVYLIKKDEWGEEHRRNFYGVKSKHFILNDRKEARAFIQIIEKELGIKLVLKANEIYKTI